MVTLPNCFVTGFFTVCGYFVAAIEGIARSSTITIAAPRRTRDVRFMGSPVPIDASIVVALVLLLPRVAHGVEARFHLRFRADVLRLIEPSIGQRLGEAI